MPRKLHTHHKLHKGYGWKPGLPKQAHPLYMARVEAAALPPLVDMRPECPPVYDQGDLGSCTGNTFAGMGEFLLMKQKLPTFVPSRLFIYWNERALDGDVPEDAGASLSDGADVIATDGFPDEILWPYDPAEFAVQPPPTVFQAGRTCLATGVQQVHQDLTTMKECLASGLPIGIGFTVYESFESDAVANTGVVPMPGHREEVLGGHAVLVVGYDDSQSRFIVRNSWGNAWGQDGYFTMPYAYLTNRRLASDFWSANGVT